MVAFFDERFGEIEAYLELLQQVETAAGEGAPKIQGSDTPITASQQKILYSSIYLQLYNLVEATISQCMYAISEAAVEGEKWLPQQLNESLLSEWVRATAKTHQVLTPEHRLERAMSMCVRLIDQLPIETFDVELGGGGNWDDAAIEQLSTRVGCALDIPGDVNTAAKRHVRDDMGALKLVKTRRNQLAHGSISFVDCADGITVAELSAIIEAVGNYLRAAIDCFSTYVDLLHFLRPEHHIQPAGAA